MSAPARERAFTAPIDTLVRNRRSIRAFAEEPVSRDLVERLLEEAIWAPSPHNSQPWRFTVLFDQVDKRDLADAMARRLEDELRSDGLTQEVIERQAARSRSRISAAPVLILCSLVADGLVAYEDTRRNDLEWQMAVQSVGAVLQTLFLLAAERGIGSCWMAAPMYCPEVVRTCLALPGELSPQELALLGYPAQPGRVRDRRSLSEVVDFR